MSFLGYGSDGAHAPGRCSNRSKCMHGNTVTESYIVAHNVLNTHAAVVEHYRNHYQDEQKGCIGIVLNQDWAEPWTSSLEDNEAAMRRREFQLGWFGDPLFFGHYPLSMIDAVGDRLPSFTDKQRRRLLHSIDFLGINHYSSRYYSNPIDEVSPSSQQKGWAFDQRTVEHKLDPMGSLIGPQGELVFLHYRCHRYHHHHH